MVTMQMQGRGSLHKGSEGLPHGLIREYLSNCAFGVCIYRGHNTAGDIDSGREMTALVSGTEHF